MYVGIRKQSTIPTANPSYRYHFIRWSSENDRMTPSFLNRVATEALWHAGRVVAWQHQPSLRGKDFLSGEIKLLF